jgi:hypothetical protein
MLRHLKSIHLYNFYAYVLVSYNYRKKEWLCFCVLPIELINLLSSLEKSEYFYEIGTEVLNFIQ